MDKLPLLELADWIMSWMGKQDSGLQAEIYLYQGEDRSLNLKEGRLETLQESSEEGMGLRLIRDGHMGFAYTGTLSSEALPALFHQARSQISYMPKDEHRILPEPQKSSHPATSFLSSLFDASMFATPLRDWEPRLLEMQSRALKADPRVKKVLHLGYGESRAEVAIANTLGVRAFERGTSGSVGLATVAESAGEVQVGSASQSARLSQDLDLARMVQEAVFRSVSLLDSKKLPSRRRAVLFDPWIAGEVLELFVGALSAEAVQRGKSLLRGKLGAQVASSTVSLSDNPRRVGGVASSCCDDEGLPTRDKRMVDRGVLKGYFYDSYTARQEGLASNGCAGRPGFKGLPGPSSSNFYMEPGTISRDQLIRDTGDGILAIEVMGMHTADPVSGEFSVGISGVAVDQGQLSHGVRGAMVSGNILDLLAQVDAVAEDLTFYGSLATPTFRVADLMVA